MKMTIFPIKRVVQTHCTPLDLPLFDIGSSYKISNINTELFILNFGSLNVIYTFINYYFSFRSIWRVRTPFIGSGISGQYTSDI